MFLNKSLPQELLPFKNGWNSFYKFNVETASQKFSKLSPNYFDNEGQKMTLFLFQEMAKRVPAYKDFLKKGKIGWRKIKTIKDLKHVPWIDKENYLKQYPLSDLSWDGKIRAPIISASSGSTGIPFFWPRSFNIEIETTYIYELFLKYIFEIDKYRTLLISGFSMGIYIGGTFTLNCCMRLAQKGYPLTIITPGINKEEILRSVERLSPNFEQIILCGYPPFIRDIIDDGEKEGINWKKMRLKFFFASESLSEEFRSYIFEKVGIKRSDYYFSSMNLYGTADAAIAGHETPFGTFFRTLFSEDTERCLKFFKTSYVPSLNQYYPFLKYFQIEGGEVVISTYNCEIPLLRYNIHDKGNIIPFNKMVGVINSFGYSEKDVEKITGRPIWRLPYVYLYGRSDLSVTLYGLNIHTENIKIALETNGLIDLTTGKFVMETKNREKDQSQYLLIHIELRDGVKPSTQLKRRFQKTIISTLRKFNSEYNHLYQSIKSKADPEINLCYPGDERYFAPTTKQRWVRK